MEKEINVTKAFVDEMTKHLVDNGKIIEAGWEGLRLMSIPPDAPQVQITEMRNAFFAGASHLFSSIMNMLDPGKEATEADTRRLDLISKELAEFIEDFKRKHFL